MEAAKRIEEALKDQEKPRGTKKLQTKKDNRGRKYKSWDGAYVELDAADIIDCCGAVKDPDKIVRDLLVGSENALEEFGVDNKPVIIFADDAYHLLDAVAGAKP